MKIKLLHKNKEQAKTENVKTDNISEIETNIFCNPLMEMARVDVPEQDSKLLGTKEIWVYANDRNPMSPHFHYFDKKNKPTFYIEIKNCLKTSKLQHNSKPRDLDEMCERAFLFGREHTKRM